VRTEDFLRLLGRCLWSEPELMTFLDGKASEATACAGGSRRLQPPSPQDVEETSSGRRRRQFQAARTHPPRAESTRSSHPPSTSS
jgi:hypothetical protein